MKLEREDESGIRRALSLFRCIAEDKGRTPFALLIQELGLSTSTAHRLVAELLRHKLISRIGHGRYDIGMTAVTYANQRDVNEILARAARPLLRQVSRKTGLTAHLGVLEDDMVTYLVKSTGKGDNSAHFTKEGMQLEAYCSAVGKVLLASMSPRALNDYLAVGEFIAATSRTVTSTTALRRELGMVRACGIAIDDREISDDMMCIAVPVSDGSGGVHAAVSISMKWSGHAEGRVTELSGLLAGISAKISRNLGLITSS